MLARSTQSTCALLLWESCLTTRLGLIEGAYPSCQGSLAGFVRLPCNSCLQMYVSHLSGITPALGVYATNACHPTFFIMVNHELRKFPLSLSCLAMISSIHTGRSLPECTG